MPARIGNLELPERSPAFLKLRTAVRPFVCSAQVVVGLSGGADSLALVAAARAEGQEVLAVCVDHQLQDESNDVAHQAAQQAMHMGCAAIVRRVQIDGDGGTEAAARRARYDALAAAAKTIWVAHTMDDQAETYLLGALRGNPAGMLPMSQQGERSLVRPFLTVRRADTQQACVELGLEPWADPHNDDVAFRRVALRKQLIPEWAAQLGSDPVPALAQAAERAALASHYISTQLLPMDVAELSAAHPAVRQASIASWLQAEVGKTSWATVQEVERLVIDWHGQGPIAVGGSPAGRVGVRRKAGRLTLGEMQ